MSKKPLVSGIIIFLNGENFLREAIESVLGQTYDHWELLLVDDGSSDRSTEIAIQYGRRYSDRVRYLEHAGHRNRGKSASRNLGLRHATGEYIALLDHDDIWLPHKLEEQVAILDARPEAGMMYGRTMYWHSWTGRPEDRERDGFTVLGVQPDTLVKPPHLVTLFLRDERTIASSCSLLIRRKTALRVGGFDEAFRHKYDDVVFLARVYLEVPVFVADGCWDRYRQHPNNSCSIDLRRGQWHPRKSNPSREMFLTRVEQLVCEKGVTDGELLEALRTQLRPYRHPEERTPRQRFYDICMDAGVMLARGEDPRPLFATPGSVCDPELDGHVVASWLFDAVPLLTSQGSSVWAELWPRLERRIEEFLEALETQAQATGLAREARRVLVRMIENKWWLRVAEGNEATLHFSADDPNGIRVSIQHAKTKNCFDIQLNQPRLRVRLHRRYSISFRARADSPRSIFLGFSAAHEPWKSLGLYTKIDLAAEWQCFEETFEATADDDNARIHFDLGESDTAVEFCSVRLRDTAGGESIEPAIPGIQTPRGPAVSAQSGKGAGRDDVEAVRSQGLTRRSPTFSRLQQAARRLRRRFQHKAVILMYHRVAEARPAPWALSVTPGHFSEHLEILEMTARPVRLQGLTRGLLDGAIRRRSVVVTFDDGYADIFHHARPLLERYGVPATVFLTSACIGREREFWWDELERILLRPGNLPQALHLNVNGSSHQWEVGEAAHYRYSLYRSLWHLLQPLPEEDRQQVLDELLVWAGAEPQGRPTHRTLSVDELLSLAKEELIEVGSHTMTHPLLSALPALSQRDEIRQSKVGLEKILGGPVTSFAYPYGDFTPETVRIVREAGFACACSTVAEAVERDADRFQLPRVTTEDWDGEEFSRRLSKWFDGT